jgi:hypothetical protein
MSNAGSKRQAADADTNAMKKTKSKDLMEVTMGNLWEHRLSAEDDKNLTKEFADYCKEKNITTKDLFLICSDEERTQAWLEIVSKLPMELVKKIDYVMQEIQKDRGSRPKSNVTGCCDNGGSGNDQSSNDNSSNNDFSNDDSSMMTLA